jgi:glucose/arabinose dehydrogenase
MDIVLHPHFAENHLLHLAYSKPLSDLPPGATPLGMILPMGRKGSGKRKTSAVLRARWDGHRLSDVHDTFVTNDVIDDSISQTSGQRLVFGRDGMLYMSTGALIAPASSGLYAKSVGGARTTQ